MGRLSHSPSPFFSVLYYFYLFHFLAAVYQCYHLSLSSSSSFSLAFHFFRVLPLSLVSVCMIRLVSLLLPSFFLLPLFLRSLSYCVIISSMIILIILPPPFVFPTLVSFHFLCVIFAFPSIFCLTSISFPNIFTFPYDSKQRQRQRSKAENRDETERVWGTWRYS